MVDRPYGRPADTEAGVIRRNVPWLTAGTESSISFSPLQDLHGIITPNGLFLSAITQAGLTSTPISTG